MTLTYKIVINGNDLTDSFKSLTSFTLTDRRNFEADSLQLRLPDPSGTLQIPHKEAEIDFYFGKGRTAPTYKGKFTVDEVGFQTPPAEMIITARSANFRQSLNEQRTTSYKNKKLIEILEQISKRQGLELVINPDVGTISLAHLDQNTESDGHLISRLGRKFGALATIKENRLVFLPLSRGQTASGSPLQPMVIDIGKLTAENALIDLNWRDQARTDTFTHVKARFHNQMTAKTESVTLARSKEFEQEKTKTIPQIFKDAEQAKAAASAEIRRLDGMAATLDLTMADIFPDLFTERPVRIVGTKSQITNNLWIAQEINHSASDSGFETRVKLVQEI